MSNGMRALMGLGYVAAVPVIVRWVPVVRERRWKWLAVHHAGMAAIIAGCLERKTAVGTAANVGWLAVSSAWYAANPRSGVNKSPIR